MKELLGAGKIKARSKWKEVYPSFADDERYLKLLGNPGSNPLELFWDVVDGLDQKLDAKVAVVEEAIRKYNATGTESKDAEEKAAENRKPAFVFTSETTEGQLRDILASHGDEKAKSISDDDFAEVYIHVSDNLLLSWKDIKTFFKAS